MNTLQEPPAGTVVFVVPELPSDTQIPNCKSTTTTRRSIQYTLKDNSIICAYKRSPFTNALYSNSKSGWFCQIKGKVGSLAIESSLNFLKLFKSEVEISRPKCSLNVMKGLKEGIACEDFCALQEALANALAIKYWELGRYEDKTGAGGLIGYTLVDRDNYVDVMLAIETICWNIRKKM